MRFEKLFNEYMSSPQFRKLSQSSKQMYIYAGDRLSTYFGGVHFNDINRMMILRFQQDTLDKPSLSNLAIRVASVVFSYAMDMNYMSHNPASRIKKLSIGSHVKWTPEEVAGVIAMRDRKISTAVALAWYTGQRESDVLKMQWKDYDGEYISMVQQKTGLEMKIKAHPDLIRYLNETRGDAPPDYYIVSGMRKMGGSAFRGMLKRRTNKINLDKVFHGIRKGVACTLAENGRPLSEIAAIMGHKSMRMAAYYAEQADSTKLTENAVGAMVSCL